MTVATWQPVSEMTRTAKINEIHELLNSALMGVAGMADNPMLRALGVTAPNVEHDPDPLTDSVIMLRALFESMNSMGQNRALSGLAKTVLGS